MITRDRMRAFAGAPGETAAPYLADAATRWGIHTPLQVIHWLAQLHHESGGFRSARESLNYRVQALLTLFGRHRITEVDARAFGRDGDQRADQEAIANCLYGGAWGAKNLGNTEAGDGWRFIGRGWKQLTGRDNYTRCSTAIYGDTRLVERPELLEQPEASAQAAGWFWMANGIGQYADRDDARAVRKRVNGGAIGLDECIRLTGEAKRIFV